MIVTDEIVRDEKTHTYWDAKTGLRILGVTELLSAMGYLGSGVFMNPDALRRGKNVHLAIHYYEKGLLKKGPGLDVDSLSPRLRPYFDSYIGFKERINGKVKLTEAFVYDRPFRLACQIDALWNVGDEAWVIDYKSGPVHDWVKYQTAAHVNGLDLPKDKIVRRFGLRLRDDGKPAEITPFDDPSDLAVIRMFASVFYRKVNDGVIKWPQTRESLENEKEQEYGIDLFNVGVSASDRNGGAAPIASSEGNTATTYPN